jgi:broad specificity phosphatase PhoE
LTSIYFVRHGQAGTRDSYDSLSELGRRQSRLLGEHFLSQGIVFAAAYSGTQARQQQTAADVASAYEDAGVPFPNIAATCGWNEFDLDQIYREIAPQVSAEDPEFGRQFEAMREQVRASRGVHDAEIHRRWTPCDVALVAAWIRGRHVYTGESWGAFRQRVSACAPVAGHSPNGDRRLSVGTGIGSRAEASTTERANVVVFTSATPTAVWVGRALDIHDERVMQLAGVLHNASYSIVRQRSNEQLQLFAFNAVPHLSAPELRTHR